MHVHLSNILTMVLIKDQQKPIRVNVVVTKCVQFVCSFLYFWSTSFISYNTSFILVQWFELLMIN